MLHLEFRPPLSVCEQLRGQAELLLLRAVYSLAVLPGGSVSARVYHIPDIRGDVVDGAADRDLGDRDPVFDLRDAAHDLLHFSHVFVVQGPDDKRAFKKAQSAR